LATKKLTVDLLKEKIEYIAPPIELAKNARSFIDIKDKIKKALENGPKSAPEISKLVGMDMHELSWYIATLLRHGVVKIAGKDDEDRYIFEWFGEEL